MSDLDKVRAWITRLSAHPAGRFEPALDEATVAAAEKELGITFPDEFRRYLREVASGYGNGAFRYAMNGARREASAAKPFPFTVAQGIAARSSRTPIPGPAASPGTFIVWDHGCGEESRLVVTGEARGTVWRLVEPGWLLDGDSPQPLGYLAWLEWWSTVW